MKALPQGTVRTRADGSEWRKEPGAGEPWRQTKDGHGGKPQARGGDDTKPADGWSGLAAYGVDGHFPHETVHPQHVQVDIDGDTDSKPILTWLDNTGRKRHAYSTTFHRERAEHLREHVAKHSLRIEAAHHILRSMVTDADGDEKADAHAAALMHLATGHRIRDILALDAGQAKVMQGANVEGRAPAPEDEFAKGYSASHPHPHRVTFAMGHRNGHIFPTSHVCPALSRHITLGRVAGPLFRTTEDEVRSALKKVGAGDIHERVVRHHAAGRKAAHALSLMRPVDVSAPGGMDQARANLEAASEEVATHFGHQRPPKGMSYVPPALATSYIEHSGGHKLWPRVFKEPSWNSTTEGGASSSAPSPTNAPLDNASTSTPVTKAQR